MFIDDILKKYPTLPKPDAIFRIQNIADYVLTVDENLLEFDLEKVFSFHVPFPICFFEFKHPTKFKAQGKECNSFSFSGGIYLIDNKKDISPHIEAVYFADLDILASAKYFYDENYKYKPLLKDNKIPFIVSKSWEEKIGYELTITDYSLNQDIIMTTTLNFLHCKNVHHVENRYPDKLIKSRQKRNKPYFEKYYTLEIDAMKKILDTEGQAQTRGLKYAFHICRGHFKTYEEKSLFGKYKGTYWWPATVRGSKDIGHVKKDYKIKI